jgi:alpha-glucosidase
VAQGDWWRHGVVYQIYPRSLQDSDGDGIGDLAGIVSRLDYLNDGTPASLGVEAIWLSPFYPSPMVDFGYDVADYTDVHPDFGTLADFDVLLAEAHRRGIRVIIDLVPNHTSDRHSWFVDSRSSRHSSKRDWYVWADPKPDGSPPNNWISAFTRVGPAWTLDEATGQYYLHSFTAQQPDLNWWNPKVRAAMDQVMRFWLDRGVDGFRIDVAHRLAKDPQLGDNPLILAGEPLHVSHPTERQRNMDWPEIHSILRRFRQTLDGYHDRMAVGEVKILDPARLVRYYGQAADELHLAFNFSLLQQPWRAAAFRNAVELFEAVLPSGAWPNYTLGNHDTSRLASRYDQGGNGRVRARVAAMLLLTLRGTPFLYYGDELGMVDVPIPKRLANDPNSRDPARTPMQWDAGPQAGFTTGIPWLPLAADADRVNVAVQRHDPDSLLCLYRRLLWYRRGSEPLRWGSYRSLPSAPNGLFAFVRETATERLLVALNFTDRPLDLFAAETPTTGRLELSTGTRRARQEIDLRPLGVDAHEGLIVRLPQAGAAA